MGAISILLALIKKARAGFPPRALLNQQRLLALTTGIDGSVDPLLVLPGQTVCINGPP